MHAWEIEWYEFPILFDSQKNFTAMQIIDKCNENEGQNYFRVVDENQARWWSGVYEFGIFVHHVSVT